MNKCNCTKLEKIAETKREILHLQDDLATKMTQFYECTGCSKIYKLTKTSHLFEGLKCEFNMYEGSLTGKDIAANAQNYKGDIRASNEDSIMAQKA